MPLIFQAVVAGVDYYMVLRDRFIRNDLKIICFLLLFLFFHTIFIAYKKDYKMMYIWNVNSLKYSDINLHVNDMLK